MCRSMVTWESHNRIQQTIVCRLKAIQEGNAKCWMIVVCRPRMMQSIHIKRRLTVVQAKVDGGRQCLMSPIDMCMLEVIQLDHISPQ